MVENGIKLYKSSITPARYERLQGNAAASEKTDA